MKAVYISGAASAIYGATLPRDLTIEAGSDAMSADPADFGIRTIATVYAANRYRWPSLDRCFLQEDEFVTGLKGFYAHFDAKIAPASLLIAITGATIANNVIYCSNGSKNRILYETFRPGDRSAVKLAQPMLLAEAMQHSGATGHTYLYLGSAGSFNYGHWLVDDLPRIKAASALSGLGRPLCVIMPSYSEPIDRIRRESIETILSRNILVEFMDPNRPLRFPLVYYVTPVSEHPLIKSPAAVEFVARQTLTRLETSAGWREEDSAKSLYLRRRRAPSRNLVNDDSIIDRLVARGFEVVDTESMSFAEQAALLAQARVVVGQMGAAMTNTLFCRPTTTVIHLAPRGWIEPFYFDLAAVRGHDYRALYGDVVTARDAPHLADFSLDPDLLERALV